MGRKNGTGSSKTKRARSSRKARRAAPVAPTIFRSPGPAELVGLPPRVDEPIERRLSWYRDAIVQLGGVPWQGRGPSDGDTTLLAIQYADLGGRCRRLRDYFSPPLEVPEPGGRPEAELQAELDELAKSLRKRGIGFTHCGHMEGASVLRALARSLDEETDPPPDRGCLLIDLRPSCPDCTREWRETFADFEDDAA